MERYYKASEVEAIICKLMREPYYQHAGEDFKAGVSAVEGELMFLDAVELVESKAEEYKTKEAEAFCVQDIEEILEIGKHNKKMIPVCYCCKTVFETDALAYRYCSNCGMKMSEEPD